MTEIDKIGLRMPAGLHGRPRTGTVRAGDRHLHRLSGRRNLAQRIGQTQTWNDKSNKAGS